MYTAGECLIRLIDGAEPDDQQAQDERIIGARLVATFMAEVRVLIKALSK